MSHFSRLRRLLVGVALFARGDDVGIASSISLVTPPPRSCVARISGELAPRPAQLRALREKVEVPLEDDGRCRRKVVSGIGDETD